MAARRLQHLAKIFLRLEQRVLRSGFADFQQCGDFRMTKAFDFVKQENVALMARQRGKGALEREP